MPDRATIDEADWRPLMRQALRVVDSLADSGYGALDFRFGGGTVLMLRLDHRTSQDVDLFLDDAQALGFISPRLNDVAAAAARNYQEQANSIKLVLPTGDIDFIVAGTLIRNGLMEDLDFEGRRIALEPTAEILAKKILYRAAMFKPRDVFDMAATLALDEASARLALRATVQAHPTLLRRLGVLSTLDDARLMQDIRPTAKGQVFADGMIGSLMEAVRTSGACE